MLSPSVELALSRFVEAVQQSLGSNLQSIVLFGSAAEGTLRLTSDVNLMVVLSQCDLASLESLRNGFDLLHAAVRLKVMFILESELPLAAEAFAVKFSDILHRHRILHGKNPLEQLVISRAAQLKRLKQVLLNLILHSREHYLLSNSQDGKLALRIAEMAGPLRAAASLILQLESQAASSPKKSLEALAARLGDSSSHDALKALSEAREQGALAPDAAKQTFAALINLAKKLYAHVQSL